MWEKNFEGKVMSPPPTSEDDINDETIIDSDVNDDIVSEPVKKPKKKKRSYIKGGLVKKAKRRSRKDKKYGKICKTCGQDILENESRNGLMYIDTYHQIQAKNYCEDHERIYSEHKCKPHWCGDCGYLSRYDIFVDWDKKEKNW